jgi:hypothetical protein
MNATFRDFPGTPLQLGRPRSGDFFVGLFQAGKQFFGDLSAIGARKTKCFGKQLVSRHDTSLTPKFEAAFAECINPHLGARVYAPRSKLLAAQPDESSFDFPTVFGTSPNPHYSCLVGNVSCPALQFVRHEERIKLVLRTSDCIFDHHSKSVTPLFVQQSSERLQIFSHGHVILSYFTRP